MQKRTNQSFCKILLISIIISIIIIIGNKTTGTPLGTKIFKYLKPWITKPKIVTPIKINIANAKVTIIWLVTVKVYGIIPNILQKRTNIMNEYINE